MIALSLALAACSGPDPFQDDDTSPPDEAGPACLSEVRLGYPAGETSPIPCEAAQLTATMEFDPDDPPELRTLELRVDGSTSAGFQCDLTLSVRGVCGPESYWIGDQVEVQVDTWDCEGTPDDFEGSYAAEDGVVELTSLETPDEVGDLTGVSLAVRVAGSFDLRLPAGATLTGTFDVSRTITGDDAEEQSCAVGGPVEASPITSGQLTGSWTLGGAEKQYRYALDLGAGVTPTDCPRCDRAGNLHFRDVQGTPPRDRSGEVVAFGVRTETGEAFERVGDVWVSWGSGAVSGSGWTGARTVDEAGRSTRQELMLSW